MRGITVRQPWAWAIVHAPIPWRGQLGLWTVPADLEATIRE